MPVTVVDASAVAAILLNEPEADALQRRLAGQQLAAPHLIALEIANICANRVRREPARHEALLALLPVFEGFNIRQHPVDAAGLLCLALGTRLTACDAAYLWLARHLGAPLVSLDDRLASAAP
jgi:predicted nucleic acid-binding protein